MIDLNEFKEFTFKTKKYIFPKILEIGINPTFYKNDGIKKI